LTTIIAILLLLVLVALGGVGGKLKELLGELLRIRIAAERLAINSNKATPLVEELTNLAARASYRTSKGATR